MLDAGDKRSLKLLADSHFQGGQGVVGKLEDITG